MSSWIPKNLPKAYDWRERGVLSSVRNQGDCGSCWTFGIAGAIEALLRINRGLCVSISRQELLDCCYNPYGYTSVGYDYIRRKGIALEKYYPYEAKEDLPCRRAKTFGRPGMRVYIDAYTKCQPNEFSLMKAVIRQPITVSGDILDEIVCHKNVTGPHGEHIWSELNGMNHTVLLVGYGSRDGVKYWIVQNSWGEEWGDEGYMLMLRSNGTSYGQCFIAADAWHPIIQESHDRPRAPLRFEGEGTFDGERGG
ncbi:hypothetical protein OROHE_016124 [Orobanche hederae]